MNAPQAAPGASEKRPSALVMYHFLFPDDVVSAVHFSQFAEELVCRGWQVTALTSNRFCRYPERKVPASRERWHGVAVERVSRPAWDQANRYLRMLNSLWMMAGWTLRLLGKSRSDVVVIGTDPQFSALLFPIVRLLRKGKVLVHWCYDLYPEAIIADGASGVLKRVAIVMMSVMRRAYRFVDVMADIGPCMRKRLDEYGHGAQRVTLAPWALVEPERVTEPDPAVRTDLFGEAPLTLLYSGSMGKAHTFARFLELARRLREGDSGIVFCFACRGNRKEELRRAITEEDTNIRIRSFADESELALRLAAADVHLMSLREEWEGVVVPSKFFGSLAIGRPVLFDGPEDSAIARWIREHGVGWVLSDGTVEQIADELLSLAKDRQRLREMGTAASRTYHESFSKRHIMDEWDRLLRGMLAARGAEGKDA